MAFTQALYYPWIDIKENVWLKNALLYWDKIHTIVPESVQKPYNNRVSEEFFDANCIIPLKVNSRMDIIKKSGLEFLNYFRTPDGIKILSTNYENSKSAIYSDKLSEEFMGYGIYFDKMSHFLINELQYNVSQNNKKIFFKQNIANLYMSILATHLAEKKGISLLTNEMDFNKFANTFRLNPSSNGSKRNKIIKLDTSDFNEGILSEIILKRIYINPETSVKKIIDFRSKHKDELGRFRTEVSRLCDILDFTSEPDNISQQINDIVINEIKPSINDLQSALSAFRIKHVIGGVMQISFASISKTSIPALALGPVLGPIALFAAIGASIVCQGILYNKKRKKIISENPYSYLLSVNQKIGYI